MALPHEFYQYAENIYRRFPEEFLALGAPGLEDVYDLRPNGPCTRCIQETAHGKTVELKLQRWAPGAPTHFQGAGYRPPHYAYQPPSSAYVPHMAYPPSMAPAPNHWESHSGSSEAPAHIVSCLTRLETALSVLAPQIQVLHAAHTAQTQSSHAQYQAPISPISPGAGSSRDKTAGTATSLTTWAAQKAQAAEKAGATAAEAAQPKPAVQPRQKSADQSLQPQLPRRPSVNINAVRVSPGIHDPQSPRSPGRYSAWK